MDSTSREREFRNPLGQILLPSLHCPEIFRASSEKDFFDNIDPKRAFALDKQVGSNADKPAVCAKFQMSGSIPIAAFEAMSEKCQKETLFQMSKCDCRPGSHGASASDLSVGTPVMQHLTARRQRHPAGVGAAKQAWGKWALPEPGGPTEKGGNRSRRPVAAQTQPDISRRYPADRPERCQSPRSDP